MIFFWFSVYFKIQCYIYSCFHYVVFFEIGDHIEQSNTPLMSYGIVIWFRLRPMKNIQTHKDLKVVANGIKNFFDQQIQKLVDNTLSIHTVVRLSSYIKISACQLL